MSRGSKKAPEHDADDVTVQYQDQREGNFVVD